MGDKRRIKQKRQPTLKGVPVVPIMEVERGEKIAGMWASNTIPGIGFYKLIAKRKRDGTCEWIHFTQREDGRKDSFYRGVTQNEDGLTSVVQAINTALRTAYGPGVKLQPADADVYPIDDKIQ